MNDNEIEEIYREIGKKISYYRKELEMSQTDLAKKLNVRQQLIADYEIARRRMPIAFLFTIAKVLSIDVEELLGLEKKKRKPGPIPKLQRRMEALQKLPVAKQQLACDVLDSIIKSPD